MTRILLFVVFVVGGSFLGMVLVWFLLAEATHIGWIDRYNKWPLAAVALIGPMLGGTAGMGAMIRLRQQMAKKAGGTDSEPSRTSETPIPPESPKLG